MWVMVFELGMIIADLFLIALNFGSPNIFEMNFKWSEIHDLKKESNQTNQFRTTEDIGPISDLDHHLDYC